MPDRNTQIRDAAVRHQIGLLRVAAGYAASATQALDQSEDTLRLLIMEFLETLEQEKIDLTTPTAQRRLLDLLKQIEEVRTRHIRQIEEQLVEEFTSMIVAEWAWFAATIAIVTQGSIQLTIPGARRLARRVIRNLPFEGRTLQEWIRGIGAADVSRIYGAVPVGLMQGRSARDILLSIFGTRALRGTNGLLQRTRNDLFSVIRTAATAFTADAVNRIADANSEHFPRDQFVAVLDSRTTPVCRSLDGRVYPREEGPIPPLHMLCRSIRVPYLSGALPDKPSYGEWLKRQSVAFQEETLGKTRAALFRKGGLTVERFVDRNGQQRTLSDLARMDAQAFEAAGLDPRRWTA